MKPVIAITMGDPAGVGPEIILKAVSSARVRRASSCVIIGDPVVLEAAAKKIGKPLPRNIDCVNPLCSTLKSSSFKPGRPDKNAARMMQACITRAVRMAIDKDVDGIVTAPINKEMIKKAGFPFPGHTEFLAHLTDAKDYRMMLGGDKLKVVLVTTHVALKEVPALITVKSVFRTIQIAHRAFTEDFGIRRPRIAVAGLNPHAGEGGLFGHEDRRFVRPAITRALKQGIRAQGPIPPDTVFFKAARGEFDCVVCMYHDQGLGPMKLLHFEDGVNVTLGLPIVRTSVDHGTAYDIAWKGKGGAANPKSMVAAIECAALMSSARGLPRDR